MSDNSQMQLIVTDKALARAGQIKQMVDLLAMGKSIRAATDVVGISVETWRLWRKAGYIQSLIDTRFKDVSTGMRGVIADALVNGTRILASIAQGKVPKGTNVAGGVAASDVITANRELRALWEKLGGDSESKEREQERVIEELRAGQVSITTVHIETVNVGTEHQPMPVPAGVSVIEGELVE